MKVNDFLKRNKAPIKRQYSQFVLQNDSAEIKYKSQIDDLNEQLGHYRRIEAERDDFSKRLSLEKEKAVETIKSNEELSEQLNSIKLTMEAQEKLLEKIPALEEKNKSLNGQLSDTDNELDLITKKAFKQSGLLSSLGKQVEGLKIDNEELSKKALQSTSNMMTADEERNQVLEKNKNLEIFTDETSKINKEVKNQNKELRDTVNYWEKEAKESILQLEKAVQVESKLRVWVSDLEKEESINKTIKGETDKEVMISKNTIKDMGLVIEDLIKENKYVRNINKEYRKELLRPNYLSMASIAKQEGFKMPNGKENIRKQNLGNSMPKLLKFEAQKEEANA